MSANIYDMVDTWNDGATTFTAIKMNVTDTASASESLLMDLQVDGVSRFSVGPFGGTKFGNGRFFFNYGNNAKYGLGTGSAGFWGFSDDSLNDVGAFFMTRVKTRIYRDSDGVFAMRYGSNPHGLNIYNTYTDASNYERATFKWNANVLEIKPEAAGTGTTRVIHISGLPTSNPGPGILWNNAGTPAIGT